MTATLFSLTLAVLAAGDPAPDKPRPPSPLAPSLPRLTRDEEDKIDAVIDRFILADIGRLRGTEARDAVGAFEKLQPGAIPALIRGLNRAARIEHSCPVLVIAKKLNRMLMASDDRELLEFARDEIGAGVGRTRHMGILQDLRLNCMLRKNALARRAPAGPKAPRSLTVAELAEAAGTARGPRLKQVLVELERRRGPEVLAGLCTAAGSYDREVQQLGRDLLDRHLARQPAAFVKEKLRDEQPEVRMAAARAAAARHPSLAGGVIDLLADDQADVRAAAHQALVRLSRGQDFGPSAAAGRDERAQARQQWRAWWERQSRR
jgi:hypothetical protein